MIRITTDDRELQKQLDDMELSNMTAHITLMLMKKVFENTFDDHLGKIFQEHQHGATETIDAYYIPQLRKYTKISDKEIRAAVVTACMYTMADRYLKGKSKL